VPDRFLRASDFDGKLGQANNPEWKTVAFDAQRQGRAAQRLDRLPLGPEGRADQGKWNLEAKEAQRRRRQAQAVAAGGRRAGARGGGRGFPYFGGIVPPALHVERPRRRHPRRATCRRSGCAGRRRDDALVATVFDLQVAQYGVDRGLGGGNVAASYDDNAPTRPAWQESITGVPREQVITVARQFAENAEKTEGKSMVIIGAAMNHWYHSRHELPRRHQHADDVRLHRQERRRLGALRGPGEAAPADRLDGAGLRAGLAAPAAPAEQHQLLLRPHRPVALREAGHGRGAVAAGRQEGLPGQQP
jgi:nitrate reductase alpha subunit